MRRFQALGWLCVAIAGVLFVIVAGGADESNDPWVDVAAGVMICAIFAGIAFALLARRKH